MTYLSPLGYLLGVEGAALLRGTREGFGDRAFVEARIAEIRALLDDPELAAAGGVTAAVGGVSVGEMYRDWAASYDRPNTLIDIEEPAVRRILDRLPIGDALDAACGTGRHAAYLVGLGHRVSGFDGSPEMLAVARERLPDAALHVADLCDPIALPTDSVDLVVCGLALSYVPDLAPVFAEFARVLRPGGHLVVSDAHQILSYLRPTLARDATDGGGKGIVAEHHRPLSEYINTALPLGFEVRGCEEVHRGGAPGTITAAELRADAAEAEAEAAAAIAAGHAPPPIEVSWDLLLRCPEAGALALDVPSLVVWHFQLGAGRG